MKKAFDTVNLVDLDDLLIDKVKKIENLLGRELIVTSGYRDVTHPIEAKKEKPGEHTTGKAVDIVAIGGKAVYDIVNAAIKVGCKRIGIHRKKNFVHLGFDDSRVTSIWTY